MSPKDSRSNKVERLAQFLLSGILACCSVVIIAEFLFLVWAVRQEFPKVASISFGNIAFVSLACVLLLLPVACLAVGRRRLAGWFARRWLSVVERITGTTSLFVAKACVSLADCCTEEEKFDEAERLYKRAVAINAVVGKQGSSTFQIHTELRYLNFLRQSNKIRTAVAIAPYLLELEKRYRPYNFTNRSLYMLAIVFASISTAILILDWAAASSSLAGNYSLAKEICEFAPTPPAMLSQFKVGKSMELLARGYSKGAQWDKAEPLYKTLLEIREVRDGANSAAAAEVMQLLSEAYLNQGKYKKAQQLLEQTLSIYGEQAGVDDPRTVLILNDLATVYCSEDKFDQSQKLIKKALSIYEKNRRPRDLAVAEGLHRLAVVCCSKGRYEQAEPLYRLAIALSEESYGPDDPRLARTLADYANLLKLTKRFDQAQKMEARARTIRALYGSSALSQAIKTL